jgi:hypothetical protein
MNELLQLRDGLTWRSLGDRVVVLDLDQSTYFSASGAAVHVWDLLTRGASRQRLVDEMLSAFDVEPDVAAADLDAFVTDLRTRRLLR